MFCIVCVGLSSGVDEVEIGCFEAIHSIEFVDGVDVSSSDEQIVYFMFE